MDYEKLIADWNAICPPGTRVILTNDFREEEHTRTRSPAWLLYSGHPVVKVDGRSGGYSLLRIKVDPQPLECSPENPCCERRGEYNGLGSGPLKFTCPKHCSCHD